MKKPANIFHLLIVINCFFMVSCARQSAMQVSAPGQLQAVQTMPSENTDATHPLALIDNTTLLVENTSAEKPAEKILLYKAEKKTNKTNAFTGKQIRKISARINDIKTGKKLPIGLQTATMSAQGDPDNGLTITGILFLGMGAVMLIPALLVSGAGFLFIIAGMLMVIGLLIMLTGLARKAE